MLRKKNQLTVFLTIVFFCFSFVSPPALMAENQEDRVVPRGTLRVLDSFGPSSSYLMNYTEGLVIKDKDNNFVPGLAESWKWIDDKTIEFKLRREVFFHNGESFNAEVVKTNWEAFKKIKVPLALLSNFSKNKIRYY